MDLINRSVRAERYFECVKRNRNEHDHLCGYEIYEMPLESVFYSQLVCLSDCLSVRSSLPKAVGQNLDMCAVK